MGYHATPQAHGGRAALSARSRIVCIVLVVAAVIALIVWIIATAGGGVLMT